MNVVWLNYNEGSPEKGYWCYGWLEDILTTPPTGSYQHTFYHGTKITDVPDGEGAILVVPAEYNADHVKQINADILSLPWHVLILASDERGLFPVEQLVAGVNLWVMTPHFEKHVYPPGTQFLGEFYPQHTRPALKAAERHEPRPYRTGFSGQITHQRRQELAEEIRKVQGAYFNGTAGFTQGLDREEYAQMHVDSRTVPAPAGPETLDSFRAFEALEAGAVPLLDLNCPRTQNGHRYWSAVLGADHPLPMISHWSELEEVISSIAQPDVNRVFAWWQGHKRETRRRILTPLPDYDPGPITALVVTSPIESHPSTAIIEETVASIRHHLPTAEIIISIDGVRAEQEHYRHRYEDYVRDLLWLCNHEWTNVMPLLFDEHQHQANMTRKALDMVDTPTILFMEHDTPLVTDRPIDWDPICALVGKGTIDMLRFHYEGRIHPEHERLMVDDHVRDFEGVLLRQTIQWSQRPHVARTDYYRKIIREHFPPNARTMIEDKMHSVVLNYTGREDHHLAIYCPRDPDGSIVRSYHLDGRKADPKYDMDYGT